MALTFPYALQAFADRLRMTKTRLYLQRYDETSGDAHGRIWAEEQAKPLWVMEATLADRPAALAHDLEARIDGLDGPKRTFLFSDPAYLGPASGMTAGLGSVTVDTIRTADRGGLGLAGLPAGFVLTARDLFSIPYAGGRLYLGRFQEGATANASGIIAAREIRPHLPFGIAAGATVELVRPVFKAFIPPGGYTPFDFDLPNGLIARGGSLRIMQRI